MPQSLINQYSRNSNECKKVSWGFWTYTQNPDGRRRLDPGSPELFYERSVQEVLDQLHIKQSFISISHEDEYSVASVMLYM